MIKNYLKTAWRNLSRGKSFSFINITGLAIGMAGAVLILLWLQNEISYDKFHKNRKRLFEVYGLTDATEGNSVAINRSEQPLAPALLRTYPEVEACSRLSAVNSFLLTAGNKSLSGTMGDFVDPSFLQLFSFPLVKGNRAEQLRNVYSIVITEKLAKKLFGDEDAIGKSIKIDTSDNFTVTGVLKNLPTNTRFDFEYLLPWEYFKNIGWNNDSWLSNNTSTFVLLRPNVSVETFNKKIKNITRDYTGNDHVWTHFLFPLNQWHLFGDFENGNPVGGRIETVRLFGLIAAFILLIACINFMNLSTARSEKRAKEVGIRKVAGAGRTLLIGQFIAEAFFTACMASVIALLIVQTTLPSFNVLVHTELVVPYRNLYFWLYAFGFILLTGLLAGSYPAFYLSSFSPTSIFRKQFKKSQAPFSPRKVLVVLQFTFTVILIISTLVVRNQIEYAQNRATGYVRNNLIRVDLVGDIEKNYPLIKDELLRSGVAVAVSKTMGSVTQIDNRTWGLRWPNENPADTNTAINLFGADANLVKTAGLELLHGRDIDVYRFPSDSFSIMLNETAVKLMNLKNPVGQVLINPFDHINWHIVGVVKDFVTGSPFAAIPPVVIIGPAVWFGSLHIKFNPARSTAESLAIAGNIFRKYNAAWPFDYQFIDEDYTRQFNDEEHTKTLAALFATLAIVISCLGLFGLSAYVAESRIKEIGVRKVLGASEISIARLLSVDFLKLVIVSIVIASPIAWYVMNRWLQGYSYRVTIGWGLFVTAGLLSIAIAVATVSYQSISAAMANPVKSLRSE